MCVIGSRTFNDSEAEGCGAAGGESLRFFKCREMSERKSERVHSYMCVYMHVNTYTHVHVYIDIQI